ncbi:MAG: hypothetical protein BroJett007_11720 [Chloroflexota bacterium]|jgi:hypothetical protein|nr:MAG: hypothetical protein BroJett007_11720 [Chloroflexota bacterium]
MSGHKRGIIPMQITSTPAENVAEQSVPASDLSQQRAAENTFMASMLFAGVRCILEYVVLPFLLPLLNLSDSIAVPLVMGVNIVAFVALIASVRKFYAINYKHKHLYLAVAVVGGVVLSIFLIGNVRTLIG